MPLFVAIVNYRLKYVKQFMGWLKEFVNFYLFEQVQQNTKISILIFSTTSKLACLILWQTLKSVWKPTMEQF